MHCTPTVVVSVCSASHEPIGPALEPEPIEPQESPGLHEHDPDVGAQGWTGSGFRPSVTAEEPSARGTGEDLGPPETRGQKVSSCTDYRHT